ncbi:phosphate transport system permease protein [Streptomyces sp. B3I7]|uniref:phosphate ABC transporter permease subunit PstC n=1 Tax=Streptomyces sp. B3I7 TaxID=3042269 RepID=UPI00277E70F9|nr:phosphate ABC transporter permease subunit PstC [Streptomyces sp. B3I7]MDQ0812598.1 phosphate transport system permease protein [Streptomyces sp. B3I7]
MDTTTQNTEQPEQPGDAEQPPPTTPAPAPAPATAEEKRASRGATRPGDRVFLGLSRGSGIFLLVIMAAIAAFLAYRASIAISKDHGNFLTTLEWNTNVDPPVFGIAVLAFGTVVSSIIAMALAVPVAVGIALFITHYSPRKLGGTLAYVIDLLAAVPSIVYGLWGALVLVPHLEGLFGWLDKYFGWTGIFEWQQGAPRSLLTVGILLAIMILPVITNVSREVFRQVPRMHEEAALALGATRWEVIRMSVLPFGRSGVISASMLGLGRALGETMAVATVLSPTFKINASLLDPGGGTFAQNIASKFGEATDTGRDALIASGLVLFVITLLVNGAARMIIARRKEYSGANA